MPDEILLGNIKGPKGDKGDKGDTGTGLKILDYYASVEALSSAVTNPSVGDAYGVGSAAPYDIYIYSKSKGWVNHGTLVDHKHSASDINGTIHVAQGGTGSTSASGAANNLQVISMGSGTAISENADLDTYKTVGNYICPMTATAITLSNCPVTSAFRLTVGYANGTTSYLYQELTHFLTGVKYYRSYTASDKTWNAWKANYSTANKPTLNELGAAPAGHGVGELASGSYDDTFNQVFHKGCGFYQIRSLEESPTNTNHWFPLLQISRSTQTGQELGAQIAVFDGFDYESETPRAWLRTASLGAFSDWFEMLHTGNLSRLGIPQFATGSYEGTGGTEGEENKITLTFPFVPKYVFVIHQSSAGVDMVHLFNGDTHFGSLLSGEPTAFPPNLTWNGNTVEWSYYGNADGESRGALNSAGLTYKYFAVG